MISGIHLHTQIFEQRSFPSMDSTSLPDYWKDWMISIAVQMFIDTDLDLEHILSMIKTKDISWFEFTS